MADTKEMNIKQFETIIKFALDPLDFSLVIGALPFITRELATKTFKSPEANKCPVRAALYHALDKERFKSRGVEVAFHLNREWMNGPDKILDYHCFEWEAILEPELSSPGALAELGQAFSRAALNYIHQRKETEIERIEQLNWTFVGRLALLDARTDHFNHQYQDF